MQTDREVERLKKIYKGYQSDPAKQAQWSSENPGNRVILRERQNAIQQLLDAHHFLPLDDKRILEIGCGSGNVLAGLSVWGAQPHNLYGMDLLPERIELAKKTYPGLHFQCANAETLEYPTASFDLVLVFTVFSSIQDEDMRKRVAAEAARVLKKGGAILWYDFRYDNPANPHVRGVPQKEIQRLFPGHVLSLKTISFLPPLTRRLSRYAAILYPLLSRIVAFRTHYLGLLMEP